MGVSRIHLSVLVMVFFCLSTVTGCLGKRDWQYPPASTGSFLNEKASSPISAKAIVLPLEDLRGNEVKEEYWKAAIPLVPYGDTKYQRPEAVPNPEEVDVVKFDPTNDLAQSIAAEFNHAEIFSSVTFAKEEGQQSADLAFRGRLRSTDWNRRLYSYLFAPVGVVFWMLGLPMSETTTALELDLRLTPLNEPSKVLWNMTMEFEGKQLDSPYYGLENAVESYPEAMQEALKPAVADLIGLANEDPSRLIPR
ncbi:MAG: hypothetical protein MRJ67_10175 [Nitrospirales bacterium]|nr:hypothetical protein [Nitrospirales bacterium]MDR4483381.1 hypothetical protein [Nitrospirales bacterium]